VNIVSWRTVLQHRLKKADVPIPQISGFQGSGSRCYGAYALRLRLADSTGVERLTEGIFYAVGLTQGPDIILGRPWRRDYGVVVDSRDDNWWYADEGETPTARVRDAHEFVREVQGASAVYMLRVCLTGAKEHLLPPELADFEDVIAGEDLSTRPLPEGVSHAIDLEPGKRPPFRPLYSLSVKELAELRKYLEEALKNGWIRRSTSEAGAPILFVPKKDGTLRLCVDYRGLNAISMKNRHPLPLIGETLDRLGNAKFFSKIDLKDAYHRIPIKRGDEWKTAFRTRYGHFEYLVMPFGLTNAPATFQAYINKALAGLVDDFVVVYLDDILIYSETREEHVRHLREVLARLRKFALYANRKKCDWFTDRVEFLGFIVSVAGVSMDRSRVAAIEEWPTPKTFREVQVFLGFANFFRRFIKGYSKIVVPLTALSKGAKLGKKPGPIAWKAAQEQAFRTLKEAFTQAPILRHYLPNEKLRLETDASGFAISAILSQLRSEGEKPARWHPIAFWSRKLIDPEIGYETHDSELLAIVEGFKQYRHYLEGAPHAIQVLTDHNNLRGFMGVKQLSGRQARWATFLAAFDFVIEHRAGKTNPADGPSRRPDYEGASQAMNTLLPTLQNKLAVWGDPNSGLAPIVRRVRVYEEHYNAPLKRVASDPPTGPWQKTLVRAVVNAITRTETPLNDTGEDLASLIRQLQSTDAALEELLQRSRDAGEDTWVKDNDLWYFQEKLYVPGDVALHARLMRIHHDDELAGHFGRDKTEALLKRKYWWPTLPKDVAEYVGSCQTCQYMKPRRHRPYGEAQALRMPNRAWEEITMDFITDLPPCRVRGQRVDSILVIVDRFTKMNLYVPTTKTCTSVDLAIILRDEVVRRYGLPRGIVTDRGSVFTSQYWSDFAYEAQVKLKYSTAFHPQTDGQTERMNQTLEQYLRCYCSEAQSEWGARLSHAEFAVNNGVHAALKMSPFEVLYGWNPDVHTAPTRDEFPEGKVPAATERARSMRETSEMLAKRWRTAQESQKRGNDARNKPMSYKVGDMVLLSSKNLSLPGSKKKLGARFVGPFRVRDCIGSQAYRLALPESYKIHNVFHVSLLERWQQRAGEEPAEPMPLADENEEWEIEKILDTRVRAGQRYYLVRWKGWPDEYTSWQPEENCAGAAESISAFEAQRKSTRRTRGARKRG